MRVARLLLTLLVAFAALLVARRASAHAPGLSSGAYAAAGKTVTAEITFAQAELRTYVPALERGVDAARAELERLVVRGIDVTAGEQRCVGKLESAALTEQDGLLVRATYECPTAPDVVTVSLKVLLASVAHGHRHVASAIGIDSLLLYTGNSSFTLARSPDAAAPATPAERRSLGFFTFLGMGIEHIVYLPESYDHIVFLLGLILVGGRIRSLVGVVTAFTIAHSITLALAAFDVVTPSSRLIEPAIALSIAYVGVENFFVKSAERRWRITFPFGLVHGFGFAETLRETGLPKVSGLISFNLGVEIGQLLIMAPLVPLILWLRRFDWFPRYAVRGLSAAIVVFGIALLVVRISG